MSCNVYQYLGETWDNDGINIFYAPPDNLEKENFDCSLLSQALDVSFNTFTLTEGELLSAANLNTWLTYSAKKADDEPNLLGVKLLNELLGDFAKFQATTTDIFGNLHGGDATNITENLIGDETPEVRGKLEIALQWISKIYSEYYGKKYLIKVGDSTEGICIKDRYGNAPSGNVKVESEGGLFYTSDSPSTGGGWLSRNQSSVMGLSVGPELLPFAETDNKIGTFVKYKKATNVEKYDLKWYIDFSNLGGDDGWYFKEDEDELYAKASIDPAIYKIDNDQYVLVTIDSGASLKLSPGEDNPCGAIIDAVGARAVMILYGRSEYETELDAQFCNDGTTNTGVSITSSNINSFQHNSPMVCPDSFCLPFKSNVFSYGPWFFVANPVGGTEVEPNNELAPWNFATLQNSGYDVMNYYGSLIASDGPRGLQKQENGSITVASLPAYPIGYIVGGNAATLTDLQINIGDNGYTTTYNFQTYAPKFGKPGRYLTDLWKNNYKSMSYLNAFFKKQQLELRSQLNNLASKVQLEKNKSRRNLTTHTGVTEGAKPNSSDGTNSGQTPNMILYYGFMIRPKETNLGGGSDNFSNTAGAIPQKCSCNDTPPDDEPPSGSSSSSGNNIVHIPVAGTEKSLSNTWYKPGIFTRLAFNSLDLIFCGVSTNQTDDTDAELPRLAMYQNYNASFTEYSSKTSTQLGDGKAPNSRTRCEIPPFFFDDVLQYDLPIHQMYLNGVTSRAMLSGWSSGIKNSSNKGFVTRVISWGSDAEDYTLSLKDTGQSLKLDTLDDQENASNFRYNILRGPLSLQAWGYDTSGKPIPNGIDSAAQAEKGKFRRRGLQDKFLKDWLANPKTWPAGPIDLRWDRERGVWVAPPANKIVVAKLITNLEKFGVAEAELIDPEAGGVRFYEEYDLWSDQGANIKSSMHRTKIKVYDFLGIKLCKCDYIYAYYDDNRYIVLESNRAYKDPNEICCSTTQPTQTQQPTPSQATPTSCWCNLECLKTLKNYNEDKFQALVHKKEKDRPDCLMWEDVVECYTTPPNFYNN